MIQPIEILEILAILMAVFGVTLMGVFALRALKQLLNGVLQFVRLPSLKIRLPSLPKRKPKPKKEETKMAGTKKEGLQKEETTFNDVFMFFIAVPLVLLWVLFAGYVIWTGLHTPAVLSNIESYTTLIAILGGPALLIIKDALDVWKTEQTTKSDFYQKKAQAVIDMNVAHQKQIHDQESKHQEQMHMIEQNEQAHHHGVKPLKRK
jgi:hypothetical protein|tara:strand:+ start:54 stop:671 length:618 start_codon:yes stop_codon:yes gene_type:complete